MHFSRSLQVSACFLSFSLLTESLVLRRKDGTISQEKGPARRGALLDSVLNKRQDPEVLNCPSDRWQDLLDSNPENRVVTFCNEWLGIEPATSVIEITPTV